MDTDWNLISIQGEKCHDCSNGQFLVMDSAEAIDARKPQAEEFVCPLLGFQNVKRQDLEKVSLVMLEYSDLIYWVVVDGIDHHLH